MISPTQFPTMAWWLPMFLPPPLPPRLTQWVLAARILPAWTPWINQVGKGDEEPWGRRGSLVTLLAMLLALLVMWSQTCLLKHPKLGGGGGGIPSSYQKCSEHLLCVIVWGLYIHVEHIMHTRLQMYVTVKQIFYYLEASIAVFTKLYRHWVQCSCCV